MRPGEVVVRPLLYLASYYSNNFVQKDENKAEIVSVCQVSIFKSFKYIDTLSTLKCLRGILNPLILS